MFYCISTPLINMDIVKAFNSNELQANILIKGTLEDPLFRASDVATVLDIKDIRSAIRHYDRDNKVVREIPTLGGIQEVSFLTEIGLYRLLMRSNKPIANLFQKWVANIVKEIRLTGKYELEKALEDKTKELAKLQKRTKKTYDRGDRVYVYEDFTDDMLKVYKIGSTKDYNVRSSTYDTTRFENRLKFETMCSKGYLLEQVVHHILRYPRDAEKKEWFHTDLETIIATIKIAQNILDDLYQPDTAIQELENVLGYLDKRKAPVMKEPEETVDPIDNKYDRFVAECCEEGDFTTRSVEITSMFRLWNKGITREEGTELQNHFKNKYTFTGRCWNEETKTNQAGFKGIKLTEFKYHPTGEEPNMYDKFIQERCIVSPLARIPTFNLTHEFIKWKETNNIPSNGLKQEQRLMRQHLILHFVPANGKMTFNKEKESGGFWGITIKGLDLNDSCISNKANRKTVYKVDPETNKVVQIYRTAGEASKSEQNDMTHKIRNNILHKGFMFTYDKPDD